MEHLTARFENKRIINDIHICDILNLKTMTSDSGKQLRELMGECKRHVDALKFYEFGMDGLSDIMIVSILASRLDLDTRKQWESNIDRGDIPKYENSSPLGVKFWSESSQQAEKNQQYIYNECSGFEGIIFGGVGRVPVQFL